MSYSNLLTGFAINLLVALVIVRFIYYPANHHKDYIFTYLTFNTIIYFVMSFMTSSELSLGVGFGLFAIFSVLRYRTNTMTTREMTYLFVVIALPVINAMLIKGDDLAMLGLVDVIVTGLLWLLEREWGFHYESRQTIRYDRVELVAPQRRNELLADLRQRTGLPIKRVEIGRLNLLNDTAELRVYFDEPNGQGRVSTAFVEAPQPALEDDD